MSEIALAMAQSDFPEQVLNIPEKILVNRNEHLPYIAEAFAETNDKEHFKYLIIPCAYYPDAAYKMCGLLARLYPGQAGEIAEKVLSFRCQVLRGEELFEA